MGYKLGDLTTEFWVTLSKESYEFFILCNEASQNIGFLLATAGDSAQAVYWRDVGFRKAGYYLSKGTVGRDMDGKVIALDMLEQNPKQQETSRFFDIFLAWWDEHRNDLPK